jgi:HK97 family phage prohead protease
MSEKRAKYTAEEIDALGKKGQAFKDADGSYSYPIADEADLKDAIRAVGRGNADHDAIRKYIIKRAKALGSSDLIPDNWNSDGSLKETNGTWATLEERETYNDTYTALTGAICDAYGDDYRYAWVQDFTDSEVIFSAQGDLWSVGYTLEPGGAVTLDGDPVKVRPVTNYVERKASPVLEWRRRKVKDLRGLERRTFPASEMELRETDDGSLHLSGYASVTETAYEVGFYTETIKRGAFKRTLGEQPDVQLLVNHEGLPLARTKSGTLTLTEDERGLKVDADLDPEDPDVQSLSRKMKRGDIDQMSFAFQATDQDWDEAFTERTIKAVSIHRGDVSVVNQGANPAAAASIRSQDAVRALHRAGFEGILDALTEWRDHTLLPIEERAGKALSAATMEVLSNVLNLVAAADEAVDEAQPMLAELMGVPNPDADDAADEPRSAGPPEKTVVPIPDYTTRARQQLALLRRAA